MSNLPARVLQKCIEKGKPTSIDDPNIVRGSGITDDCPNALPVGSKYQGVEICGAIGTYGLPCIKTPCSTGRCQLHTKVSAAYKCLSKKERDSINDIKIGDLTEEIKIFKALLYRQLKIQNENDVASVKLTISLMEQVRALEAEQFKLSGGASATNPVDTAMAMQNWCKNAMNVSIEIREPKKDATDPNTSQ